MTKLIIKAQRLDEEFNHDMTYEWTLETPEELYNFRRMQIPREHYTHVYVTISLENHYRCAFIANSHTLGQAVFNRIKDFVFRVYCDEIFR